MKKSVTIIFLMILVSVNLSGQNSTMTIREVFDFQPGDVFHWSIDHLPPRPPEGERVEVLARSMSSGNDTLCYTLKHFDYSSVVGPGPALIYTYDNYISQECFTNLDSLVHTLIDTVGMITTPVTLNDSTYLDGDLCDSLTYKYRAHYGIMPFGRHVWKTFGKGLGVTNYYDEYTVSSPTSYRWKKLVYFKKGPDPCGIMDTTSTGIPQPNNLVGHIKCFPNPATTHLNLEFDSQLSSTEKTITLLSSDGQEVLRKRYLAGNSSVTLNISNLPAGIYVMQVTVPGLPSITRKVVKRD